MNVYKSLYFLTKSQSIFQLTQLTYQQFKKCIYLYISSTQLLKSTCNADEAISKTIKWKTKQFTLTLES